MGNNDEQYRGDSVDSARHFRVLFSANVGLHTREERHTRLAFIWRVENFVTYRAT
jgi:hypothetical protein